LKVKNCWLRAAAYRGAALSDLVLLFLLQNIFFVLFSSCRLCLLQQETLHDLGTQKWQKTKICFSLFFWVFMFVYVQKAKFGKEKVLSL